MPFLLLLMLCAAAVLVVIPHRHSSLSLSWSALSHRTKRRLNRFIIALIVFVGGTKEQLQISHSPFGQMPTHHPDSTIELNKKSSHQKNYNEYEVVTTDYGWTTTASNNFTRTKVMGEFFRAVTSHQNYNQSAFQDLEKHPDPSRKLAVFMDIDTCLEFNYPTYNAKQWWDNMEEDHPATGGFLHHITESCQYIQRAAKSPALLANPNSKLVLIDCSGSLRYYISNVCGKGSREFKQILDSPQIVTAYISVARRHARSSDIGLPPPAIKPINLTSIERRLINHCIERKYLFSFQGNPGHGRDQMEALNGEDDVYVNLVGRRKYVKDITVGGDDVMNYAHIMRQTIFAAAPRGDNLFSYRFAEILSAGSVPVVYADGWLPPFNTKNETKEQAFDWSECAVFIPESDYNKTIIILRNITNSRRCKMQQCALEAWERYVSSRAGWLRGILDSLPYTDLDFDASEREESFSHES